MRTSVQKLDAHLRKSKISKIQYYIERCKESQKSLEHFRMKKHKKVKPIIKREIYVGEYLKGRTFVNPHIDEIIKKNTVFMNAFQRYLNNRNYSSKM